MISYGRQSINEKDIEAVSKVLKGDWLTTGPLVEEFELALSVVVGTPTAVVSSGTAALHAAYAAIGLGQGDEIITPPITFIATQATAELLGAKAKFADVKPGFPNIDPAKVEEAITEKTKAIVAVDYAGMPADLDELRIIADKHSLFLIEDAAHSLGSTYKGRQVGSIADITTFSFYPTKNITTGEGGAVASKSSKLLQKAREFSRQGLVRDPSRFELISPGAWHQEVQDFGLNYRLPDVLCALGISQLSRLEEFKSKRKMLVDLYIEKLMDISDLKLVISKNSSEVMWHLFPVRIQKGRRREIFDKLRIAGIGAQVNYIPAFMHPVFKDENILYEKFPNSINYYEETISLPLHAELTEFDVENICNVLIQALRK